MRQALVVSCTLATFALSLLHCTPDFESLRQGETSGAGGSGVSGGGSGGRTNGLGGANEVAGGTQAGASAGGSAGTTQATGGASGAAGDSSEGGNAGSAGSAGSAGEAGAGASDPCAFKQLNALAHNEFNEGLAGEGFAQVSSTAEASTTVGSTASAEWDPLVGRTCPGSFRVTGTFKGYASTSEVATGDLRFASVDWSGAKTLHAWVKVQPTNAPLQGIQLFIVSGSDYRFAGRYDNSQFVSGTWYELTLPLTASSFLDPTSVYRLGLQIVLKLEGSPDIPATPPTTSAWLDDIWVEQ